MTISITPLKIVVAVLVVIALIIVVPAAVDFFSDFKEVTETHTSGTW